MDDESGLKALVDAYARAVDGRDFDGVASLFTADGVLIVNGRETRQREAIISAMRSLEQYDRTEHVVHGTKWTVDGDTASGITHGTAHHIKGDDDRVVDITYVDTATRDNSNTWRFTRRELT